jgi:hypothetical protein
MEMSQQNLLFNYHILIKVLRNKNRKFLSSKKKKCICLSYADLLSYEKRHISWFLHPEGYFVVIKNTSVGEQFFSLEKLGVSKCLGAREASLLRDTVKPTEEKDTAKTTEFVSQRLPSHLDAPH